MCLPAFVWSQEDTIKKKKSTLFDVLHERGIEQAVMKISLDTLIANKLTPDETNGKLIFDLKGGGKLALEVEVQARGKFRRMKCDFPPLRLDFDKSDLKDLGLKRNDKYKLVTHCVSEGEGDRILLKEYLAYQLYQLVTPNSFRTILFPIEYLDTTSGQSLKTMAFMIEDEDQLADRLGGDICDCLGREYTDIDPLAFEHLALFQYMIGNADMDFKALRNLKLVQIDSLTPMTPVAFDFDFSCFVHPPYAYQGVQDLRTLKRDYLGYEGNRHLLKEVCQTFLDRKDAVLDYIKEFDLIPAYERRECLNYVKDFYRLIESRRFVVEYGVK